jgi:uncharacterized protein YjbJ (UPF0337 family)
MNHSTRDQAEGKFHESKGTAKEKLGKVMENPDLQDKGANEKAAGKVQKKAGEVEKVIGQ